MYHNSLEWNIKLMSPRIFTLAFIPFIRSMYLDVSLVSISSEAPGNHLFQFKRFNSRYRFRIVCATALRCIRATNKAYAKTEQITLACVFGVDMICVLYRFCVNREKNKRLSSIIYRNGLALCSFDFSMYDANRPTQFFFVLFISHHLYAIVAQSLAKS